MRVQVNFDLTARGYGFGDYQAEVRRIQLTLAQIEEGLTPQLEKTLLEAAKFMRDLAKIYVRVKTGSLQKSIRVEHIKRLAVRVRAGGYVINPITKRLVDYAIYVEKRYPFLKPAWDSTKKFVKLRLREEMERLIHV